VFPEAYKQWEIAGARRWWETEPDVGRMDDGVSEWVDDRLQCLGNAVSPWIAEWIGRRLMDAVAV